MSPTRLWAARLLLVIAAPGLTLAACEVAGWLADTPLLRDRPDYQSAAQMDRCHSARGAASACTPDKLHRGVGRTTIAVLGGSSVHGYPIGVPSFVDRTQRELARRAPGVFRVVNLGLYCKDTLYVRACADGVAGTDLDLLVIYAGHNDFANWMGRFPRVTMFVERNAWVLDVRDWLAGTHSYSLLVSLLPQPGGSEHDYSFPPDAVFRSAFRTILDAYAENIGAVLDRAEEHGVPVLLVTLVSNLYDYPYVESDWDTGLALSRNQGHPDAWRAAFAAGVAAHRAERFAEALRSFQVARDALPLGRAPSVVNEMLRRLAVERDGVSLLDFERILEADANGSPIGCSYFGDTQDGESWCDQFHPSQKTHELLTSALVDWLWRFQPRNQKR